MTTNYTKITLAAVVSSAAGYQPADHRWGPEEATSEPEHIIMGTGLSLGLTTPFTLPLAVYTTIGALLVKNIDAVNALTVSYASDSGAASQVVAAGKLLLLTDIDGATDIEILCAGVSVIFKYMLLVTD